MFQIKPPLAMTQQSGLKRPSMTCSRQTGLNSKVQPRQRQSNSLQMMIQHSWLFIESASNEVLVRSSNNVWKLLFPTTASERVLSLGGEAECALSYSHWDHSGLQRQLLDGAQEGGGMQPGACSLPVWLLRTTINTLAFRRGRFFSSSQTSYQQVRVKQTELLTERFHTGRLVWIRKWTGKKIKIKKTVSALCSGKT